MTSRATRSRSGRNLTKTKGGHPRDDKREDRVDYDMQQALAMRGQAAACAARARPASSPKAGAGSSPSSGNAQQPRTPTADDVGLALRGLDRAEELEKSGDLEEALRIYQLSIEALIRYINASPKKAGASSPGSGGLDREAVTERVRTALTEAERIKSQIGAGQKQQVEQQEWNGMGGYISSAFGYGWSRSRENSSRSVGSTGSASGQAASEEEDAGRRAKSSTDRPTSRRSSGSSPPKTTKRTSPRHHAAAKPKSPAADEKISSAKPRSSSRRSSPAATPTAAAVAAPPQRRKRSNLDYTSDPLVKTIKDDLYVDSANIKVKWDDISGLSDAKRSLQEAAILPLLRPDLYTGLRSPPKGILLYGPPGTGKTMLVKAVAHESKCILFACTASAMTSKWHGEGEKLVRTLFRMAADVAPSILFFDEIDALLSSRKAEGEHEASRRFKTEFMVQMDGIASGGGDGGEEDVQHRVLVIGCTNCPWDIDDAVMRRFQRRIYIPLPDADARGTLLRNMLKKAKDHNITSGQVSQLVKMTEGYSCSDISSIAQEAAFGPLRSLGGMDDIRDARSQDVRPINASDFKDAIQRSKRSVTPGLLAKYDEWEREQMAGGH